SAPIKYRGVNLGVIVGFKPAEDFYKIAKNIKIGEKGFAYILNDSADVISHPTITDKTNINNEVSINFTNLKNKVSKKYSNEIAKMEDMIMKGKPRSEEHTSELQSRENLV